MGRSLSGSQVLVLGGSSGIGLATAKTLKVATIQCERFMAGILFGS